MARRRYRCAACGNLTRFTVTSLRRTTAFHHFTVGGDLTIEDEEVLDERVEDVTCRWCGNGSAVVAFDAGASEGTGSQAGAAGASAESGP
ncbi:MAG: hypothetical protein M3P34_08060 [Actinomycetota bacterium]|nr:hypothetical protein [Actinomycetota bacterium]